MKRVQKFRIHNQEEDRVEDREGDYEGAGILVSLCVWRVNERGAAVTMPECTIFNSFKVGPGLEFQTPNATLASRRHRRRRYDALL